MSNVFTGRGLEDTISFKGSDNWSILTSGLQKINNKKLYKTLI
jgi:hypothetical protein